MNDLIMHGRFTEKDFVTDAVGIALKNKHGEILVVHNTKLKLFSLITGKVENGENSELAVTRETYEETGVYIIDFKKIGQGTNTYNYNGKPATITTHVFESSSFEGEPINREPSKHPQMEFLSLEDLKEINRRNQASDAIKIYLKNIVEG